MSEIIKPDVAFAADVNAMRIARIYVEALLAAAQSKGQTDVVLEELDSLLDDVFKSQPQLEILFSGAALGRIPRRDAINKAFANRASETFVSFLHILNEHDRLDLIRSIRHAVHEIDDERKNRLRVLVQSAVPLSDDFRHALTERIRSAFQMEPILDARIAPELLGGMKIRIGDLQVDSSVQNYLENMKKNILARSSHEIQSRRDRFSTV
jgi:F-type H+-transporting ATPase subunit delta